MRTSLTQLTPDEIDDLLQICVEEAGLDLKAVVKIGDDEADEGGHGDPVYYHPTYAIKLFAAGHDGDKPERLQFWVRVGSDIKLWEVWEIWLGEILAPRCTNVATVRVVKWFLDHGFKLWSEQQSETPETQQVSEAMRDEINPHTRIMHFKLTRRFNRYTYPEPGWSCEATSLRADGAGAWVPCLQLPDACGLAPLGITNPGVAEPGSSRAMQIDMLIGAKTVIKARVHYDDEERQTPGVVVDEILGVGSRSPARDSVFPPGAPMQPKPQMVADLMNLNMKKALEKIRTAGFNEDPTAQWMQKWAARGLDADMPQPSDTPPAPTEPSLEQQAEDFADMFRGRDLSPQDVEHVLHVMRLVYGKEATDKVAPFTHGPKVEKASMPEEKFLPLMRKLLAETRRAERYDYLLTPLMPADLKDWHQNSREEWPEVAADYVRALKADDTQWDGTDAAHPAWWRGNDAGVQGTLDRIEQVLDGKYDDVVKGVGPYFGSQRLIDVVRGVLNLKQWVNDLQSGLYINCVYCGHRYGPNDPRYEEVDQVPAEVLQTHIRQCPEHPLAKALKCLAYIEDVAGEVLTGEAEAEEALGEILARTREAQQ
ncbi:MAG: hypothetical protein ACOC9B_06050 [Chloroflexota bacterium]